MDAAVADAADEDAADAADMMGRDNPSIRLPCSCSIFIHRTQQMVLTEDQRQSLLTTVQYIVELFKLFMGCMLAVVVPQRCVNEADGVCTLRDNFVDLIPYNQFVLALNFVTLGTLMGAYTVEYLREAWCIQYLDQDRSLPDGQLQHEIGHYPVYRERLLLYNRIYYRISMVSIGLVCVNLAASAVLTTYYYYLDYRSVTNVLTNSLLIVERLYHAYDIAVQSRDSLLALSAYLVVPVVYNTMDEDYRADPSSVRRGPFTVYLPAVSLKPLLSVLSSSSSSSLRDGDRPSHTTGAGAGARTTAAPTAASTS